MIRKLRKLLQANFHIVLTRHFVKAQSIRVLTPKDFVEQVREVLWFGL